MQTISIIQIIIAIALTILILLQQRDTDTAGFLGGGGGGGGGGGFYQQRRGMERLFFVLTIILTIAFAALALTSLLYHETPALTVSDVTASSTPITIVGSSTQAQ